MNNIREEGSQGLGPFLLFLHCTFLSSLASSLFVFLVLNPTSFCKERGFVVRVVRTEHLQFHSSRRTALDPASSCCEALFTRHASHSHAKMVTKSGAFVFVSLLRPILLCFLCWSAVIHHSVSRRHFQTCRHIVSCARPSRLRHTRNRVSRENAGQRPVTAGVRPA